MRICNFGSISSVRKKAIRSVSPIRFEAPGDGSTSNSLSKNVSRSGWIPSTSSFSARRRAIARPPRPIFSMECSEGRSAFRFRNSAMTAVAIGNP